MSNVTAGAQFDDLAPVHRGVELPLVVSEALGPPHLVYKYVLGFVQQVIKGQWAFQISRRRYSEKKWNIWLINVSITY